MLHYEIDAIKKIKSSEVKEEEKGAAAFPSETVKLSIPLLECKIYIG